MGAPRMRPCSLPNATRLPVNVSAPNSTSKPSAPMVRRDSSWQCVWYSLTPTSAVAKPPNACDRAIRSGILVMGMRSEMAVPMAEPMPRPIKMPP